jgi:exosome complex exonuclease RRP6
MEDGSSKILSSAGFDVCNAKLQATALTTIRKAVSLPSDVTFHRSMDHSFAQDLDTFSERVLLVTNKLLNLVATVDQSQSNLGKGKGKLASQDDVVDDFHSLVVDSMDQLLEKTVSFQRCFFSVYI